MASNNKIQSLQALRAIAFLGIFLFHAGLIWGNFGGFGASVFICLSGFLMTYSYYNKKIDDGLGNYFKFAIGKIKRLYPLHIITMLMVLLLFIVLALHSGTMTSEYAGRLSIYTVLNVLLLQTWVPIVDVNVSLNGVAWYLSVCLVIYFAFPLLLKLIKKYKSVKSAYLAMITTYIFMVVISILTANVSGIDGRFHTWITYCFPFFRILDFFIGCNAGYIFLNRDDSGDKKTAIYTIFEILALAVVPFLVYWSQKPYEFVVAKAFTSTTIIFLPVSVILVYLFAVNRGLITKILTNKVLLFVGDLSPYMFLIHFVEVLYVSSLLGFLGLALNKYIIVVIHTVFTLIGALLYKKIEVVLFRKK